MIDIGEGMCYGECCELCKNYRPVPLKQIIHYMFKKKEEDSRKGKMKVGEIGGEEEP